MCLACHRATAAPYKKRVRDGRQRSTHREIAERALGRPLRRNEVVHHINMDPSDNRPENLLVCTKTYHGYLHWAMSKKYAEQCAPPIAA